VQYLFNWGDGTTSGWLPVGTTSAHKSWTYSTTYTVKVQARCATHTSVVSAYSTGLPVSISFKAQMVSPVPGSTLTSSGVTFSWSAGQRQRVLALRGQFRWGPKISTIPVN
jgi:hypothetical protein